MIPEETVKEKMAFLLNKYRKLGEIAVASDETYGMFSELLTNLAIAELKLAGVIND